MKILRVHYITTIFALSISASILAATTQPTPSIPGTQIVTSQGTFIVPASNSTAQQNTLVSGSSATSTNLKSNITSIPKSGSATTSSFHTNYILFQPNSTLNSRQIHTPSGAANTQP